MEPDQFCLGARSFLTVLKVNPQNSRSGSQKSYLYEMLLLNSPNMNKFFSYQAYLSRLFFASQNYFGVVQQYKTETGSSNIF